MSKISDYLGEKTGKSVLGCYASFLHDCDGALTREHFFPLNGLSKLFRGNITVNWHNGQMVTMPYKNAFSRCLCRRHNKALGQTIDPIASKFINLLDQLFLNTKSKKNHFAIDGYDLAYLLLKMGCGYLAFKNLQIPSIWVENLFTNQHSDPYICIPHDYKVGHKISYSDLNINYITNNNVVTGIKCRIGTVELYTYVPNTQPILKKQNINTKYGMKTICFTYI
jgi:hypothetical protein